MGTWEDLDQEEEVILEGTTLLGLETLGDPTETHQVEVIEDLVGLEEEEAVLMLITLALITICHRIVGHINTRL